jgi:integrase/recombinase XerD
MADLTDTRRGGRRETSDVMTDLIAYHVTRCRRSNTFSPITIRDREELLHRVDVDLPLGITEATTEDLQEWLARPGWSAQTRATYFTHMIGFYRDVADQLGWDPSAGLIRPKVPRGLPKPATEDEVRQSLADLPAPWDLYVMLAAAAGLRSSEVAGLDRRNVTEALVTVHQGKGGKSRTVETHPDLWRRIRLAPPGPIARLGSGRVMTGDQMSARVRYQLDRIGLAHLTMHRFRHRFATMLLRPRALGGAGADLLTVSELMGHANPNTTKIYALITSEQRRLAVNALPALAPASS